MHKGEGLGLTVHVCIFCALFEWSMLVVVCEQCWTLYL